MTPSGTTDSPCNYGAGRIDVLNAAEGDAVCGADSGCPTAVVGDGASLTLSGGGSAYNGNIYSDSYKVPGGVYIHWWHNLQGRSSDALRYSTATRWYGTPQAYTVTEGEGPAWALVKDGNADNDIDDGDSIIDSYAWGYENGGATTSVNEEKAIDVTSYAGDYIKVYIESSHGGGGDDSLIQIDDLFWSDSAGNEINLFSSAGSEEVGPGPVGYWGFDEGYGTTANDVSGQGNNGTISGAVWKPESECKVEKCLWFDGSDDFVNAGNNESLKLSSGGTIGAWVKINQLSSGYDNVIIMKGDGASWPNLHYTLIEIDGTDQIGLSVSDGTSSLNLSGPRTPALEENTWYHIVATWDSSDKKIYLNGELQDTVSSSIMPKDTMTSCQVDIGRAYLNSYYFNGLIDEVMIYPYARTADQIKQDYNAGLSGAKSISGTAVSVGSSSDSWMTDGLVGHWKMDETASPASDFSGNGGSGTWGNNATSDVGKFGNGVSLDGIDDYVEVADSGTNPLDLVSEFSFSAWVYYTAANGMIFNKESSYEWMIDGNGDVEWAINTAGTWEWHDTNVNVSASTWTHLVLTYDGTNVRVYKDGELGSTIADPDGGAITVNNSNLCMGTRGGMVALAPQITLEN